jgi:hypothetical protein
LTRADLVSPDQLGFDALYFLYPPGEPQKVERGHGKTAILRDNLIKNSSCIILNSMIGFSHPRRSLLSKTKLPFYSEEVYPWTKAVSFTVSTKGKMKKSVSG